MLIKKLLSFLIVVLFLLNFSLPLASADVWQAPPGNPPNGNRERPIDVSSDPQIKAGDLTIQGGTNLNGMITIGSTGLMIFPSVNQQSAFDIEANLTRNQGLLGAVALINNSNNGQAAHSLYVSNSGDSQSTALYAQHNGSGWAGYFNGPVGIASGKYLVVGGAVQAGYSSGGDLYLYGKEGIAGNLTVGGVVKITGGTPGAGKVLTSDATGLASWQTSGGTPAGSNTQVQYNNAGAFAGDAGMTYDAVNDRLTVGALTVDTNTLYVDATNNRVGVGLTNPGYPVSVVDDNSSSIVNIDNTGALLWSGVRLARSGTEKWFIGSDNATDSLLFRRNAATNDLTIEPVNGNVGIGGATDATAKLTVNGQIKVTGGTPGVGKVLTSDANGLASWQTTSGGYWSANTNDIYNNNTGLIGIGTQTPRAKVGILSGTPPSKHLGQLALYDSNSLAAGVGGVINFGGYYQGTTPTEFGGIGAFKDNNTSGDYAGYLSLFSRATGAPMVERVRITSGGNVGIGTTNPGGALEVNGESIFGSSALNIASGHNLIYGNITNASAGNLLLLQKSSADMFKVDNSGNVFVKGAIRSADSSGNVIIQLGP